MLCCPLLRGVRRGMGKVCGRRARRFAGVWFGVGVLVGIGVLGAWPVPAYALPSSFGSEGPGAGQISGEPAGVAVEQESGDVFISDRNNSRIDEFGPEGEFIRAWGWGVADGTTAALQTCTTSCFAGLSGSGAGQFGQFSIEGIAVDNSLGLSHGDVYVVNAVNRRVEKFGPEGEFILMLGGEVNAATKGNVCLAGEECQKGVPGSGPGEFEGLGGRSIAVDNSGTVYVGDQDRVQLFNGAGELQSAITLPGVENRVENLAVDSTGDLYVKGSELAGVRKYDNSGTEVGSPRDEEGQPDASAITIGPANELFVNDRREGVHHIFTFNAEGEQLASFDAGGDAADGHRGIAYSTHTEALYVLNEGKVRIVTPPPPGPLVVQGSQEATELTPTSASLRATINPEGPEATKYHFEYGTTAAYGLSTPEAELAAEPFEDHAASGQIEELEPRTTYHFRVVATNGVQTVDGPDQTFTTLPPVSVDSISVTAVSATSARLQAELNPHGEATEYRFEYGVSAAYGSSVPVPDGSAGSGLVNVTVSNLIQGLLPSTTYHYRLIAHNQLGTTVTTDQSFSTQGPSSQLADGRIWEMVSPPNKHGAPLEPITEEGGLLQASAAGGTFAYVALGPVETDPQGVRSPSNTQLFATRGSEGWSTEDITTPHEAIAIIQVGFPSEYKFFADDLQSSVVEPAGVTPLSPQTTERTPYLRAASGQFTPLLTASNVPPGAKFANNAEFRVATPDLSDVVFASTAVLAPGFKAGFESQNPSIYELTDGTPKLVSVLPDGEPTAEAGLTSGVGDVSQNMRGAISSNGDRVVFETNFGESLYMRDLGLDQTVRLDERQPGAAGGPGKAVFQAANADGSKVFFTDAARLTADSTAQPEDPDLYLCEVGIGAGKLSCALSDLSVDHNVGEAANVQGLVSAIDASGEHVFFAANGVLTSTPNAAGEVATPGDCKSSEEDDCNLYEYNTVEGRVSLAAVLSSHDDPVWAGRTSLAALGNLTARSSPDGHYFTFMSRRSLTGYDNHDARSGVPDEEVFQLDTSSGKIACISCNPTGSRPSGVFDPSRASFPGLKVDYARSWRERWLAGSIPGWTLGPSHEVALYQSRYLDNSGREFFNSSDILVAQDTNSVNDVYEFERPGVGDCTSASTSFSQRSGGCVSLVSSGSSREESTFLDASESGDEAFFLTNASLTKMDVNSAFDVYDAHLCSVASPCASPPAPPVPPCEGDACQHPSVPPSSPTPGSLTYKGPGNVSPPPTSAPKAKPLTKAQLLARALKTCKKKKVKKKRQACERQARKKYGKAKAKKKAKKSHPASRGRHSR